MFTVGGLEVGPKAPLLFPIIHVEDIYQSLDELTL